MMRRIGRWTYRNHDGDGLNPGWRLDGTRLILDYDRLSQACAIPGAYVLWTDGVPGQAVDHYLAGAMAFVEAEVARPELTTR